MSLAWQQEYVKLAERLGMKDHTTCLHKVFFDPSWLDTTGTGSRSDTQG